MPSASYARVLRTLALKVDRKKSSTPDLAARVVSCEECSSSSKFFSSIFPSEAPIELKWPALESSPTPAARFRGVADAVLKSFVSTPVLTFLTTRMFWQILFFAYQAKVYGILDFFFPKSAKSLARFFLGHFRRSTVCPSLESFLEVFSRYLLFELTIY